MFDNYEDDLELKPSPRSEETLQGTNHRLGGSDMDTQPSLDRRRCYAELGKVDEGGCVRDPSVDPFANRARRAHRNSPDSSGRYRRSPHNRRSSESYVYRRVEGVPMNSCIFRAMISIVPAQPLYAQNR
jgi:hypothetical protein